jgi:hypothetical protein
MPARPAAVPGGPSPAGARIEGLDAAHCDLSLRSDEIARALGANARRLGDTGPSPVPRERLAARAERTAAVRRLRRWLGIPTAAVTAAALVEPLVEPPPPTAREPGRPEPEGPGIRRSGRPAGSRA